MHRDGAEAPARLAQLRALLDPRRRAHLAPRCSTSASPSEVRDFLRWYAPHQFADGKIPCCIDERGRRPDAGARQRRRVHLRAGRVPAHDARRGPRARALAPRRGGRRLPRARCARERTDRRRSARRRSARSSGCCPSRSATRATPSGRCTASGTTSSRCAASATPPGSPASSARRSARTRWRRARRRASSATSRASMIATMERAGIAYLPASVELADFDPTATAVWLATGGEPDGAPRAGPAPHLRRATATSSQRRLRGHAGARGLGARTRSASPTPSLRLGQRERAADAARARARRPAAAGLEPVARDPLARRARAAVPRRPAPRLDRRRPILHALRSMLVYERAPDGALVVGGRACRRAWLAGGEALRARLPTAWGDARLRDARRRRRACCARASKGRRRRRGASSSRRRCRGRRAQAFAERRARGADAETGGVRGAARFPPTSRSATRGARGGAASPRARRAIRRPTRGSSRTGAGPRSRRAPGTGFSAWRGLARHALRRSIASRTPAGVFVYLRDLESGALRLRRCRQPCRRRRDRSRALHAGRPRARRARTSAASRAQLAICVHPERDVELRRIRLRNERRVRGASR